MTTPTPQRPDRKATPLRSKVEDNTLDAESGQSYVATPRDDRESRVAVAAYLRAERRGFAPGAELEDWLEAEKEEDSRRST